MTLTIRNLSFAFGAATVLEDISFEVQSGEFCVLLGRNGSGKTTLLHCLAGLLKPAQGRVHLDGLDLTRAGRGEIARRMGLAPQENSDIFPFSVLDVVVMGRTAWFGLAQRPSNKDYQAAMQALRELDAEYLAERNFNRISGGERRIALLARTLLQSRSALLLDEPVNHLDFKNQHAMMARIRRVRREHGALVIASMHDPNMARLYADTVVLLRRGRVLARGPVAEVMTAERISELYETSVSMVPTEYGAPVFLPAMNGAMEESPQGWS